MGLTSTENGCSTNNSDGHKWPPFANIPPCLIGMEACASAHFWANKLISMGHNVKLMALSSSNPMLKPISMMLQTLKLFVKPSLDLTCGSCRSKPLSSKPYWHFTGVVRASSNSEPHKPIKSGVIGRGIVVPEVSSSYSDDYLSSWKMRITRYPSCLQLSLLHGVPVRSYTRQAD